MRRVPTDFAEYHRRRWRARLLTLPYALAGGYLAYAVVRALTGSEGINPFGLIPFLLLLALAASAWHTLGHAWRRSFAARPVTQSLDPTPGVAGSGCGRRGLGLRLRGRLRHDVDAGLLALLGGDRRRRTGQRVVAPAGLRERDDVADRVGADQQGRDPVPAERDPTVRRGPEGEGVEEPAEPLLDLLGTQSHHVEHALLDVLAVDTDRAAADLVPVADDVVGIGQGVARVGLEAVYPFRLRRGERVVHSGPRATPDRDVVVFAGGLEERGVHHPDEGPGRLVDQPVPAGELVASRPRRVRC